MNVNENCRLNTNVHMVGTLLIWELLSSVASQIPQDQVFSSYEPITSGLKNY